MNHDQLKANLLEHEPETLAEFIVDLQGRDEAIDRRIEVLAAGLNRSERARQLLQKLRHLTQRRTFIEPHESPTLVAEIERFLAETQVLLEQGEAEVALDLSERLLCSVEPIFDTVDDSSGAVGMALVEAGLLWLRAAKECRVEGVEVDWCARIQDLRAQDKYSILDVLLPNAAILLNKAELRELARHYEAHAQEEINKAEGFRGFAAQNDFGLVAKALRDPDLYVHSITMRSADLSEQQKQDIAECYLECGDPTGALAWLEGIWEAEGTRLDLEARALEALGDDESAGDGA